MSDPVFIFLPARNGGAYLRAAVASILAQDDPNWRLIILENGTQEERTTLQQADPRIEIHSCGPLSIEENWARIAIFGANLPQEALMTFLGHDDLLKPQFVRLIRLLAERHHDATLFQTYFDLIDSDGALIRPCRPVPEREDWIDLLGAYGFGMRDAFGTGYACRVRDYRAVGGIPALPHLLYADHLLFLRLTKRGYKACERTVGCAYRLHNASTSNSVSARHVNLRVEALSQFVTGVIDDFPAALDDESCRYAVGSLLAHELVHLDLPVQRRLLTADNGARLHALRTALTELGGTGDPAHWMARTTASFRTIGRARLQARYLRAWLSRP